LINWYGCGVGLTFEIVDPKCLEKLGALLGTLVEDDDATLALEYARFRVKVLVRC